ASYTVRFVKTSCAPIVSARSLDGGELLASNGAWEERIEIPAGALFAEYALPILDEGEQSALRFTATRGCVQLEAVRFSE
ncbi:MAG: hypothetical protein IJ048_10030, partial [Clostridia bacterium]|nr:hypothetical protein [Clostridia bacterium]